MTLITSTFGTTRGLVRLALSYGEIALGAAGISRTAPGEVKRLVFVCHGNICRSAFADVAARKAGLRVASFGLSTDAGKGAHSEAIATAAQLGVDMAPHRTMRANDFEPQAGDYLLAMETRQLRRLAKDARLGQLPRNLLGLYASPMVPHLHDPYHLDPAYMLTCLKRIDSAVANLVASFPGARV